MSDQRLRQELAALKYAWAQLVDDYCDEELAEEILADGKQAAYERRGLPAWVDAALHAAGFREATA